MPTTGRISGTAAENACRLWQILNAADLGFLRPVHSHMDQNYLKLMDSICQMRCHPTTSEGGVGSIPYPDISTQPSS